MAGDIGDIGGRFILRVFKTGVGAVFKENFDRIVITAAGSVHQGRPAVIVARVDIGARVHEGFNDPDIIVLGGDHERRFSGFILCVDIGFVLD